MFRWILPLLLVASVARAQSAAPASDALSQLGALYLQLPLALQLIIGFIGGVVPVCSALANAVSPSSRLGKFLHLCALNGPKLQKALVALEQSLPGKSALVMVLAGSLLLGSSAWAEAPTPTELVTIGQKLVKDVEANNTAAIATDAQQIAALAPSTCVDKTRIGCRATLTLGPAIGVTLFAIEGAHGQPTVVKGPDFGGGGIQAAINFWPDKDGDYMAHVSVPVLIGGGTVDEVRTASILAGVMLGFGGFGKVPLFSVGPSMRVPLNGAPVQFALAGDGATLSVLQAF